MIDDDTRRLLAEAQTTQGYSEGDLRSLVRSLASALTDATTPPPTTIEQVYQSVIEHHTLEEVVEYARQQDQWCCVVGCGSGGCETCPCCAAGWCVNGADGVPEERSDQKRWLKVARHHNPIAAALYAARKDRS